MDFIVRHRLVSGALEIIFPNQLVTLGDLERFFLDRKMGKRISEHDRLLSQINLRWYICRMLTCGMQVEIESATDKIKILDEIADENRHPCGNLIEAAAAVRVGAIPNWQITRMLFSLRKQEFKKKDVDWSIHLNEKPLQIFLEEGVVKAIVDYAGNLTTGYLHPAWISYLELQNRELFELITHHIIFEYGGIDQLSFLLERGGIFLPWHERVIYGKIAHVKRFFPKRFANYGNLSA